MGFRDMKKKLVVGALVTVTLVGGAGVAMAEPLSTPGDLGQGVSGVSTLLGDVLAQLGDVLDGQRPEGVDGTEVELPDLDPRFVEGPVSGLLENGPFE